MWAVCIRPTGIMPVETSLNVGHTQTGVPWDPYITEKPLAVGPVTTAAGPTTTQQGPNPQSTVPPRLSSHFDNWAYSSESTSSA